MCLPRRVQRGAEAGDNSREEMRFLFLYVVKELFCELSSGSLVVRDA